jgi:desulfoferrodoxin-like iron-binding protein
MLLRSTDGIEEVVFLDSKVLVRISKGGAMSQLGKRYRCQVCGTEILCTKAGEGNLVCCDKEMEVQEPKPLPSSD